MARRSVNLDEKAAYADGRGFWNSEPVDGLPSVLFSDGPHGLRKQQDGDDHLGISQSVPATCFPPAAGLAQSWSPELLARVAGAIGRECRAEGVGVLLGPGVNIRRSPLGGRNFEYFSEDPVLTAALGTAWVRGLQVQGVGASVKHFAANNQETDRQRSSSDVAPRPLREVYLRAFQRIIEEARPWTVMASYNRVNGEYAGESSFLLDQVLRGEWGFDGLVVSDWGGVSDRVAAAAAGLDLEMPGSSGLGARALADAVRVGRLPEEVLDRIAGRLAGLARRVADAPAPAAPLDLAGHHALAREAATRSIVLLRNTGGILPLSPGVSLAVIGAFAAEPRIQGAGSSRVNPTHVDVPLDEIRALAGNADLTFSGGFNADGTSSPALIAEAVAAAGKADVALVFAGVPAGLESEGWDRDDIELPAAQLELVEAVHAANHRTVVVLTHGGVVRLGPIAGTAAILDCALLGQGGGRAIAEVLFGVVNPSGRLTETIPLRVEDTPSYLSFPGEHGHVTYGEGIFVGYRGYDARCLEVAYPFGHGLSYTTFAYSGLMLSAGPAGITATITVTNTGDRAGRDVPQFYVAVPRSAVVRPPLELKAFAGVELEPGESTQVTVLLRAADLAYWDARRDRWVLETAAYRVSAGASSRDLRLTGDVDVAGDEDPIPLTMRSTVGELAATPAGQRFVAAFRPGGADLDSVSEALGSDAFAAMAAIPLERMVRMTGGQLDEESLRKVLDAANTATGPGDGASAR
jgi:beta-glucosidase